MAHFQIVQEIFAGNRDTFVKNFEKKVEQQMNNGWKLVNCTMEGSVFYAFMQKD